MRVIFRFGQKSMNKALLNPKKKLKLKNVNIKKSQAFYPSMVICVHEVQQRSCNSPYFFALLLLPMLDYLFMRLGYSNALHTHTLTHLTFFTFLFGVVAHCIHYLFIYKQ